MFKFFCLLAFCLTAVVGSPSQQRIVGGSLTTIDRYPFTTAILINFSGSFHHQCGGTILNNRSILSAAHCFWFRAINEIQIRVGSSFAHSGGSVHSLSRVINYPHQTGTTQDTDIAVVRVSRIFTFGNNVQPGRIPGSNYNLGDNQAVWVIGWGFTVNGGSPSEQLRHVQIWTVNQNTCRNIYNSGVTDNILCAGHLNVGGRGACTRDSGGPLLHNGVVVGIVVGGRACGSDRFPDVYTRVSRFSNWIQSNA